MKTYIASVTRDGKWWMIRVAEIDGLTQARRLSEAEQMAREFIASTFALPLEEVAVTVELDSVGSVHNIAETMRAIRRERAQAQALESEATRAAAQLARLLAEQDVPLRDIGTVLGVSHQRAHQLLAS
ncbi:hypothetical protein B7R22_05205 [Subtercola boreus]|uniref:HicB family toxin-antitoxin system n=1 Tax=Subtercola boreus TaxID=120213 RepID=A0A3E0W355_9MICO|nr:hypothetical protein [Subtercola boreus]RFA15998.1 hypothetical protein B7R22_05205 [Subtercola boreus]